MIAIWSRGPALSLLVLIVVAARPLQAAELSADVVWHDVTPQAVEGQGWQDVESPFDRLPARAKGLVRDKVWELARHSAGLYVDFTTDADQIYARWTLTTERVAMPHMPATGVSGVDLYVKRGDGWIFAGAARPGKLATSEARLVAGLPRGEAAYRLHFPLYNGVKALAIGIPPGAKLQFAARSKQRPIVLYGTSITQGGCASRPGMSYAAILARRLGVPVINLGFSGNGKSEPEVARLVAELDPALFVLDPLGNMFPAEVADRIPVFIDIIRERHPDTPILLNENLHYPTTAILAKRKERVEASNAHLRRIVEERSAAGERHLSIIPAADLTADEGDTTVDGTHPTDHGFVLMANAIEPTLREALQTAKP